MVVSTEEDAENALPEAAVLEKWMMGTAKEADTSAAFLRRMLRMNPAYAQYLSTDDELGGIVQLFAKRFRHIILGAQNPIQLSSLHKPICELTWRVVGLVFGSIMEMTSQQQGGFPMPKEVQGQVKMLLETNIELSNKLSESRRAYLRELSALRDNQRNLSEKTLKVINSLHEDPIMFYEPLEFVLDETTKEFVKSCVEERLKLEMRTCFSDDDAHRETQLHMEDLEQEVKKMQAEMRKANATALRQEDRAKKAEMKLESILDQIEKSRAALGEKEKQLDELSEKLQPLEEELALKSKRLAVLEAAAGSSSDDDGLAAAVAEANAQVEAQLAQMKAMQEKIDAQEHDRQAREEELTTARSHAEQLEVRLANSAPITTTETVTQETVVEKIVYVESTALQEQLDKTMTVEQELRGANEALCGQLEEEQKEVKRLKQQLDALRKEKDGSKSKAAGQKKEPEKIIETEKVIDQGKLDAEVSKARDELSKKHEKESKEHQAAMEKLRAELESAKSALQEAALDTGAKKKKKAKDDDKKDNKDGEELAKLRETYDVLMDEHEDLQHEYKKLEAKVEQLIEKLKETGGAEVVADTLARIKLTAPAPRKKKKKKAFERLYDDAQRRIVEMRLKAERAERAQERVLVDVAAKVSDRKSFMAVKGLCHLQKAATATMERFNDAVTNFQNQHPDGRTVDGVTLGLDGYALPGDGNTTIPEEGSPEWVVAGSQSEGLQSHVTDGRASAGSRGGGRGRSEVRSSFQPHSRFSITQERSTHVSPDLASDGQARSGLRGSISSDGQHWQACFNCGHRNSPSAKFCEECGNRASAGPSNQASHIDPALSSLQSRDLSPALSPWKQSPGTSPQSATSSNRSGFPNEGHLRVSPGASPQKSLSLNSRRLQPAPSIQSAGEANLRSGQRVGISNFGSIGSDDLPPVVVDGTPTSSLRHEIDAFIGSQSMKEDSSKRRFVRLGSETVLGGTVLGGLAKNLPVSAESTPSSMAPNFHSPSPLMQRSLGLRNSEMYHEFRSEPSYRSAESRAYSSVDNQTSSSGGLRRTLPGGFKAAISQNSAFMTATRSTPDLTVSSRQLYAEKDKNWEPLSRGRHAVKLRSRLA